MNQPQKIKKNKENFNTQMPLILSMIVICTLIVFTILFLPLINSIFSKKSFLDSFTSLLTVTNNLGGTIGGLLGPIVALLAALLTYWAFMEQVKANKKQAKQFKKQFRDQQNSKFESRFFELLAICNTKRKELNDSDIYKDYFDYALRYFEFHNGIFFYSLKINSLSSNNNPSTIISKSLEEMNYKVFNELIYTISYPAIFGIGNYKKNNYYSNDNRTYLDTYIETLYDTNLDANNVRTLVQEIDKRNTIRNISIKLNETVHFGGGIYKNISSYMESLRLMLDYISKAYNNKTIDSNDMDFFYSIVRNDISENEELFIFIFQLINEHEQGFLSLDTIEKSRLFYKIDIKRLYIITELMISIPFSTIEEYYAYYKRTDI